jgi:hypothetical protein
MTRLPPGFDAGAEHDRDEMQRILGEGGPALLEHLEHRLGDDPLAFAGVLLEAH